MCTQRIKKSGHLEANQGSTTAGRHLFILFKITNNQKNFTAGVNSLNFTNIQWIADALDPWVCSSQEQVRLANIICQSLSRDQWEDHRLCRAAIIQTQTAQLKELNYFLKQNYTSALREVIELRFRLKSTQCENVLKPCKRRHKHLDNHDWQSATVFVHSQYRCDSTLSSTFTRKSSKQWTDKPTSCWTL